MLKNKTEYREPVFTKDESTLKNHKKSDKRAREQQIIVFNCGKIRQLNTVCLSLINGEITRNTGNQLIFQKEVGLGFE